MLTGKDAHHRPYGELIDLGQQVLVTSFTHSAIDNILAKLEELFGEAFLGAQAARFGHRSLNHINARAHKYLYDPSLFVDREGLEDYFKTRRVHFTTCLGINSLIFSKRGRGMAG